MSENNVNSTNTEVFEYQAEMKQLLDILVHSLYTEREIFLRELISNASDALNKIQFLGLTDSSILDGDSPLEIKLSYDEDKKIISIEDNGIGMSKDEIIKNIGTIASSGTLKFLKEMKSGEKNAENLIGQFGVGFYSAFMVAEKIVLETRSYKPESQGWEWTSDGSGQYSLAPVDKEHRGTKINLYLKEDGNEFCSQFRLESIVKKYSNYISFPIILKEKTVNQVRALWSLPKNEIKEKDYEEFYKQISHDFKPPFKNFHFSIEAPIQYSALLFIPQEIGNDVLYSREATGINLYAQRVFIQSDNKHLLPPYLRFIKGLVDSEDIPLNVSRENIQHNALLEKIKKSLVGRILKELKNLADNNIENYIEFWKQYGNLIKEGVSADFPNRSKLVELLYFNSSIHDKAEEYTSLKDYVTRMRDDQKEIYYAIGASRESIQHNPNLEYFKEKGLEVLFLFEHIDDFLMTDLREYEGKLFKSISQADVDALKDEDKNKDDKLPEKESKGIIDFFKKILGDKIAEVVESKRLVGSPCSLVNPKEGISPHMEKMMKMVNKDFEISKKNLEVNMSHQIIRNISDSLQKDKEDPFLKECVEQLFQNALMVEGLVDNPLEMLPRINKFIEMASKAHLNQVD